MTLSGTSYSHKEVEEKWIKEWLSKGLFTSQVNKDNETFSIALPPPNVTGELHMGHALGGTIQDILIRYHRMLGYDVLWQIGTDHAGIGTQLVVEKHLKKTEKKSKYDLDSDPNKAREKFIDLVKEWKEKYGNKIIEQMKRLGFSPDYDRCRYTMDEHYSRAVHQAFLKYWQEGLIYRSHDRTVNWCPHCLTSVSDLEITKEDANKKLYEIKYFLNTNFVYINITKDSDGNEIRTEETRDYLVVATTRPETMFGDVAVAINPRDERYKNLINLIKSESQPVKAWVPFTESVPDKAIPVILDEYVKTDFGTGALKVTPANDRNDNEIVHRYNQKYRSNGQLDKVLPLSKIFNDKAYSESKADYPNLPKEVLNKLDEIERNANIIPDIKERVKQQEEKLHELDTHSVGIAYITGTIPTSLFLIPFEFQGLDRYEAREKIVAELESNGQLVAVTEYKTQKESHDRCGDEIMDHLSPQRYVKMKSLAEKALSAIDSGKVTFKPENRYNNIYKNWLDNIQDWCISRQIWWGHRMPVLDVKLIHKVDHSDGGGWNQTVLFDGHIVASDPEFYRDIDEQDAKTSGLKFKKCISEGKASFYGYRTDNYNDYEHYYHYKYDDSCHRPTDLTDKLKILFEQVDKNSSVTDRIEVYVKWEKDVLDTWFSSALWPFVTLQSADGKSETDEDRKVFEHFYPTNVLATAREIINLWVIRMIYSSLELVKNEKGEGQIPFENVLIHPVVQTPDGKRMSKSKGNAIDPLDLVESYGADASRMWYASVGIYGQQDVKFPGHFDKSKNLWLSDTLEQYKRFTNKLYNAAKFVLMNLGEGFIPVTLQNIVGNDNVGQGQHYTGLGIADKWILNKLYTMLTEIEIDFQRYDLSAVQQKIYEFVWFNFCDWYIELAKVNLGDTQRQILFHVLESSLRVLHPIMPFITEEIWQTLVNDYDIGKIRNEIINSKLDDKYQWSISFAKYPTANPEFRKFISDLFVSGVEDSNAQLDFAIKIISNIRNARQTLNLSWSSCIDIYCETLDDWEQASINTCKEYIKALTKSKEVTLNNSRMDKPYSTSIVRNTKLLIPLAGLVDVNRVRQSIEKKIENLDKDAIVLEARLKSDKFISNAPEDKIREVKESLANLLKQKNIYAGELSALTCS